jgi:hypothetical protein
VFGTIKEEREDRVVTIPSSIFRDRSLAPLESISEYLKDQCGMSFHEIAVMLNRDDRTIWTCYTRAKKKHLNPNQPLQGGEQK